jgi:hypothetical protein
MLGTIDFERGWSSKRSANSGGPSSRTRSVRIASSLLGQDTGQVRCPRIIRLGLRFPIGLDPVKHATTLLRDLGHNHPEDLRELLAPPDRPYICRSAPKDAPRLNVASARVEEVLRQALMLGLCTAHRYDPLRAVLWTQASLVRALDLFDPEGFYA